MELRTAVKLIEKGVLRDKIQTWADLGAGGGLFTNALSQLLPKGSSILAIDKKSSAIIVAEGIELHKKTADFTDLDFPSTDGILIANAFHYVKDQANFLRSLKTKTSRLILVEYNTEKGNAWVPYPISFNKLQSIADAKLLGEAASQYQANGMYSALILF
jgi:2-polyprenyl-3-methyl-5-hydroxy-6-metoxy-1,4-benzoquinol methylase